VLRERLVRNGSELGQAGGHEEERDCELGCKTHPQTFGAELEAAERMERAMNHSPDLSKSNA
jgi:hypothetical protein